jgi:hypothetical protein
MWAQSAAYKQPEGVIPNNPNLVKRLILRHIIERRDKVANGIQDAFSF